VYDDELDPIEQFYDEAIRFIAMQTHFSNYEKMTEESRAEWQKKLTLMVCFEFSPRRNYDIPRTEIARLVRDVIEYYRGLPDE
jgi:hypothetical protein